MIRKLKITMLLGLVIAFSSFSSTKGGIDDIDLKIIKITYGPHMTMKEDVPSADDRTFYELKVKLTNAGNTDCYIDFKKSYITDKDNNYWSLDRIGAFKTYQRIKPAKTEKFSLYYEFPQDDVPKYLILGNKVFEAKINKNSS